MMNNFQIESIITITQHLRLLKNLTKKISKLRLIMKGNSVISSIESRITLITSKSLNNTQRSKRCSRKW